MTGAQDWIGRVGRTWAGMADATDRSFREVTAALLERIEPTRYGRALDIGCGAGDLTLALAAANPVGDIVGVDISADLIAVATERGDGNPSACFVEDDAATTAIGRIDRFDLLVSRHGVMFFPDPVAAFAHLRTIAAPGARLVFSCFRAREENRWALQLAEAVGADTAPADPTAPGPFAFGDRERVEAILAEAGWQDIAFDALDCPMTAGEGADAVEEALAYYRRIGPAARALAEMPEEARAAALDRLRTMLAGAERDGVVALPAAVWLVSART